MSIKKSVRQWVTPIILGSFIVSGVTGVMLFFKMKIGFVPIVHEWLSWVFIIGAIVHCLLNLKPLKGSLFRPTGAIIVILFLVVTIASPMFEGKAEGQDGHHRPPPQQQQIDPAIAKMETAMGNLPLTALAQATGRSSDEVVDLLASKNIVVEDQTQTLIELASQSRSQVPDLLKLVL